MHCYKIRPRLWKVSENFQLMKKNWFFGGLDSQHHVQRKARWTTQTKGFVTQRPDGQLLAKWLFIVNTIMYIYPPSSILFLWIDESWLWSAECHFGIWLEGTHHSWRPGKMNSLAWALKIIAGITFYSHTEKAVRGFGQPLPPDCGWCKASLEPPQRLLT